MMRRHRSAAGAAATVLFASLACQFEPEMAELRYSPNRPIIEKNSFLAEAPGVQAQLEGALEMMFGTPKTPRFLALSEWLGDDFDPNFWGEDLVAADERASAALVESNRKAYHQQIEAIRRGDFAAVVRPRGSDDLWGWWLDLRAEIEANGPDAQGEEGTLRDDAVRLFETYYPTLAASATLYQLQCYHCHGAEGGGDGSTSRFLVPRPRDYRRGIFKFTAQKGKARPRHEDLFRVLADGIYTTAMPSFRRFTDAQLHGLVDYVRLLAIRGETELLLAEFYNPDDGFDFAFVQENYTDVVAKWRDASASFITVEGEVPEATPERIAHGQTLFMTTGEKGGANCVSCHGTSGRGDGASAFEVDAETQQLRRVKDDWGNEISVRDLTGGVFRFGRRPVDLYRRIYAGINGTPMPEHIGMTITEKGQPRAMTEDDIWDLAFFVRSLASGAAAVPAAGGH